MSTPIRIDRVLTLPDSKPPLVQVKMKVEEQRSYHLKIINRLRQHQYPDGFEIERFLHHRLRRSPHTPAYFGSLLHKGEFGVLTAYVGEVHAFHTYNLFVVYPQDERERLRALVQIFMDIFFQLHQIHGPKYPARAVPQQGTTAASEIQYAHKDLKPRNLRADSSGSGLPRAVILDFDVSGAIAQQTVLHQPSWYDPPEYQDPASPPISSPSRDIFSVSAMLFGAVSPTGINLIELCHGIMLSTSAGVGAEEIYRRFLGTPISELDESIAQNVFSPLAPDLEVDTSSSLFGNMVRHCLKEWKCLSPGGEFADVGHGLKEFLMGMAGDRWKQKDRTALHAFQLFAQFWDQLRDGGPGVAELYPDPGPPREYGEVRFDYNEVRLPIKAADFQLDLEKTVVGEVAPTITFDSGLQPYVDEEQIQRHVVSAGGENLVFERLEIDVDQVPALRFKSSGEAEHDAHFLALLEYDAYTNPVFLSIVFDERIERPQWIEKLNLEHLETEIEKHFGTGSLPGSDGLAKAAALWRQMVFELDDSLLNQDRQRWAVALAVLLSNLLMVPEDQRRELDLEPIPVDLQVADTSLLKNITALVDVGNHLEFTFEPSFHVAACLRLLRLGYEDLVENRYEQLDELCSRLAELRRGLASSDLKDRISKSFETLETLSRLRVEPAVEDEA